MKSNAFYIIVVVAMLMLNWGCISTIAPKFAFSSAATGADKTSKTIAYSFRRTSRCSTSADFDKDVYDTTGLRGAWATPQKESVEKESVAISQFRKAFSHRATEIRRLADDTNREYDCLG